MDITHHDVVAAFPNRIDENGCISELIEIRALIADCEKLILKYGEDFTLRRTVESMKSREKSIIAEKEKFQ